MTRLPDADGGTEIARAHLLSVVERWARTHDGLRAVRAAPAPVDAMRCTVDLDGGDRVTLRFRAISGAETGLADGAIIESLDDDWAVGWIGETEIDVGYLLDQWLTLERRPPQRLGVGGHRADGVDGGDAPVRSTLVEDVLLVLMRPGSGRLVTSSAATTTALVGAVVYELLDRGRVVRHQDSKWSGSGTLEVVDASSADDGELDAALGDLVRRTWRSERLANLHRRGLRKRTMDRLLASERVSRRRTSWTRVLTGRQFAPTGTVDELRLRAQVAETVRTGRPPSRRAAAVAFLAATQGVAHKLAGVRKREVHSRVEHFGPWWLFVALKPASD